MAVIHRSSGNHGNTPGEGRPGYSDPPLVNNSSIPMVVLTPAKRGIATTGGTLDVLIRVQTPMRPTDRREGPPLHLALVVDRSGSMAGQPLHEALRCAEYIVTHLSPHDRAAIVVYDTQVRTLIPLRSTADPTPFVQALRGVTDGGSTALHAGWLEGARLLAPHTSGNTLSRVLLLSDGQANVGLTEPREIATQCRELSTAGVSTTTIGLGRNFNEDLMVGMAREGGGQHYYGQTAEDLQDAFREELALVQALYARHGAATLVPGPGVMVEVLSVPGASASAPIALSDVAYNAEVWLLVRLHYTSKTPGNHTLLSVVVRGDLVDGGAFELPPIELELPAVPPATWEALPTEELVTRRRTEVDTAGLYDEVRAALIRNDRPAAAALLTQAKEVAKDNEWMTRSVDALQDLVTKDEAMARKEALFQSEKARRRQAPINEPAAPAPACANEPTYLRRKTEAGKKE